MNTPDIDTEQQDRYKLGRDELMANIDAFAARPSLRAPLPDNAVQR